jgi:hypothetical protein
LKFRGYFKTDRSSQVFNEVFPKYYMTFSDFCIKFQLPKRVFIKKKKTKIKDILVFFVFLTAKINKMVLIESSDVQNKRF